MCAEVLTREQSRMLAAMERRGWQMLGELAAEGGYLELDGAPVFEGELGTMLHPRCKAAYLDLCALEQAGKVARVAGAWDAWRLASVPVFTLGGA
jgi:hypothetical protein